MKDWTQHIPDGVTKVRVRYIITDRYESRRRQIVCDTLAEAQYELERRTGSIHEPIIHREVTVTHLDAGN